MSLYLKKNKKFIHYKKTSKNYLKTKNSYLNITNILNFNRISVKRSVYNKTKKIYNQGLILKKTIQTFYDDSFSINFFKKILIENKQKSRFFCFISILIEPFFRLDILLWKLKKFNSTFLARQAIYSGYVLINNEIINQVQTILINDVITFKSNLLINTLKYPRKYQFLLFFLEIDFYSETFIYFKKFSNLTEEDIGLLYFEYIKVRTLRNYVLKK